MISLITELYLLNNSVEVQTGVRQGCVLSPLLCNLVLDPVMREACAGIESGLNDRLEDLNYVDDICLLSHKYSDISPKLQAASNVGAQTSLKINVIKTKAMRINTTSRSLADRWKKWMNSIISVALFQKPAS